MILEDAHGNYVDREAYYAAYDALQPFTQHAQIRDHIAKEVAVAVIAQHTDYGMSRLAELSDAKLSLARATLAQLVHGGLDNINIARVGIEAAVAAAAQAVSA